MPISTNETFDVKIGTETVDTIGLSDTINNYTWDELASYNYVGSWTEMYRQMSPQSPNNSTYVGYCEAVGNCPFAATWRSGYSSADITGAGTSMYNLDNDHGIYRKIILLHDITSNYPQYITPNSASNFKVITSFTAKKYTLEYDTIKKVDNTFYSLYDGVTHQTLKFHTHLGQDTDDDSAIVKSFRPYFIFKYNNNYYCVRADIIALRTLSASYITNSAFAHSFNNIQDVTGANMIGIADAMTSWYTDTSLTTQKSLPFIQSFNSNDVYYSDKGSYITRLEFGVNNSGFFFDYAFKALEGLLLFIAGTFGLHFIVDGTIYKPIIQSNFVTGYTDNLDTISDIDTYTDTNHTMPDVPPAPTPAGDVVDKETEMPLAYIGGNAGMVTFYEINKSGLASADDISEAISRFDIAQIGKDLLRNFISFKAFAAIRVDDTVDRQIKIAGIGLEDSGGHELTGRVIGGVKPIDLFPTSGGVTIPTLYNDYRDYEPYTRIQMYVPFCGWFSLPSWCIGKKITGTMFTDLYNGTVKAVIYASDTVVAEVGGCCAYDIPFVADATGMKAGAVISSALTTAAAVGATVAMPNIATGIAAVSAAANLAATLNGNDTTLKGVLGDGSNLNGLLHVYIKVSRPKSPNGTTTIPDSYKHEIGIPTMKEVTISAGDGYIQVMDAKVNGTMTAREKQMIVDGFRHGLNF